MNEIVKRHTAGAIFLERNSKPMIKLFQRNTDFIHRFAPFSRLAENVNVVENVTLVIE